MARGNYAVLAPVSRGYSPLEGRLVTCYSPGRHFTHGLLHFLVRLACVRHAASVDSEPGSNSRLKPELPSDGQSSHPSGQSPMKVLTVKMAAIPAKIILLSAQGFNPG